MRNTEIEETEEITVEEQSEASPSEVWFVENPDLWERNNGEIVFFIPLDQVPPCVLKTAEAYKKRCEFFNKMAEIYNSMIDLDDPIFD